MPISYPLRRIGIAALFLAAAPAAVIGVRFPTSPVDGQVGMIGSYPVVTVTGTHAQVGRAVGEAMAGRVHEYYDALEPQLSAKLRAFARDKRPVFEAYVASVTQLYPRLVEEVMGFAEGAKVDPEFAMLMQFQFEVDSLGSGTGQVDPRREACSDIHIGGTGMGVTGNDGILAHNEDGGTSVLKTGYFSNATYTDVRPDEASNIFAFHYPGALAGNAFSWNGRLAITNNALFPTEVRKSGVPRNFANRDAIQARTSSDCIARSTISSIASGFNLNIASAGGGLHDVEVGPGGENYHYDTPVHTAAPHFNNYLYLRVPSVNDTSSVHRLNRYMEFPMPTNVTDARAILGDHQDAAYPIFRNGAPPDSGVATLATMVADVAAGTVMVWAGSNPMTNPPSAILQF